MHACIERKIPKTLPNAWADGTVVVAGSRTHNSRVSNRSSHPASAPKTMKIRAPLLLLSVVLKKNSAESEEQTSFFAAAPASDDINAGRPAQGHLLDLSPLGRDLLAFSLQSSRQAERRKRVQNHACSQGGCDKDQKGCQGRHFEKSPLSPRRRQRRRRRRQQQRGRKPIVRKRPSRQVPTRKGETLFNAVGGNPDLPKNASKVAA